MKQSDKRLAELTRWVKSLFEDNSVRIEPASADASFRRYFRVYHGEQSQIVMDAPPDKENSEPFVRIAGYLEQMGLTAPRVLHQMPEKGYYLLSDLGDQPYLPNLTEQSADKMYHDAIQALAIMQSSGTQFKDALPAYDESLLQSEMALFTDWFLSRHLDLELSEADRGVLQRTYDFLIQSALEQPKVFVHRDYHSRNLMLISDHSHDANPGILDFQDAVWGPMTYDLVSLLRDCYISWPPELIVSWVQQFYDMMKSDLAGVSFAQFMRWFDLMGIQRHLKATGIFCRLNYRDNKPGYLNDIPRTFGYIFDVSQNYPELDSFSDLLKHHVVKEKVLR